MKPAIFQTVLIAVMLLADPLTRADDAVPQASIRVDVQMVSVSPAAALSLVPALSDEKTIEEANARLQKMIANDEATLLGWPVLWLQNGIAADRNLGLNPLEPSPPEPTEHNSSETIEESRYPTEFDPPQPGERSSVHQRPVRPSWGAIVPTTFETRNLGTSLEAQAEVDADGRNISIVFAQSLVRLLHFEHFRNQTSPLGIEGEMVQPRFVTSNSRNRIRLRNRQLALLNVFVFSKPEPHVELFLVRAKTTLLNSAKPTPSKK